jgi:hypothetical protein
MRTEAYGKLLKLADAAVGVDDGAGTLTGGVVDRQGFDAARVGARFEAPSGSPSTATATLVLQHGDESNGSDMADYETLLTATDVSSAVLLEAAANLRGTKRYVRVKSVLAFTGGSSPASDTCLICALTGSAEVPVS